MHGWGGGGVCAWGACMARRTYFVGQGGHAWLGGMHGGGTCMGDVHVWEVVCGRGCARLGWGMGMAGVGACVAREGVCVAGEGWGHAWLGRGVHG